MRDRHFASLLGPTFRNRSYLLAATSFGHLTTDDTFPPPGSTGYKPITGTIFDLLDKNNITWADYYQDAPQGASFRTFVTTGPGNNDPNFLPLTTFFAQAAAGALPSVSFVDPNFGLTGTTPENDEHPPTEHPAAPPNHLTHRDEYAHPLEDMFDFAAAPSLNTVLTQAVPPAIDCTPPKTPIGPALP